MPPQLPSSADFSSNLGIAIVSPPDKDAPTNVLVLLHGLGDKKESFANLGRQMRLPETVCIAVDGPKGLLDLDGFHWGDDIMFDSSTGGLDADSGLKEGNKLLRSMIEDTLITKCGYEARSIVLFGFGQGGMLALYTARVSIHSLPGASLTSAVSLFAENNSSELGGVISIGAALPSEASASLVNKCKVPILVCAGNQRSSVTPQAEEKLKRNFEHVDVKKYRRPGDSMPSNRDEMMPIMQFFSRRLRSTKGVPEGSIELK